MSFFLINDIRLNLPMGWVPFQLLYLGPFSNVRCTLRSKHIVMRTVEIDEEVLESMFEQVEYLHSLVRTISRLLVSKKPDDLLTTGEAAAILRMSTRHLNNLKAAGKIPFIQIDGRIMYLASDIAKYIIMQKAKI